MNNSINIKLTNNNLIRDLLTVKEALNQQGKRAELVWILHTNAYSFQTSQQTHIILPAITYNFSYLIPHQYIEVLREFHYRRNKFNAYILVHFKNTHMPYKAFFWRNVRRTRETVSYLEGVEWDYKTLFSNSNSER
ncbi:MAG: hypothetical protein IJP89_02500 [Synergistaceae bacterium]|nr:hypothetical protein [Synergistaceae bacterium]